MDADRFEALLRSLVTPSRRGILAALAAALGATGADEEVLAKRKRRKRGQDRRKQQKQSQDRREARHEGINAEGRKKKKKKKKKGSSRTTTVPPPVSPPPSCPQGQRLCRGTCQSVLICCDDSDCTGGRTCQEGTCACPPEKPHVCAGSTICRGCCSNTDCPECQQCGTDQTCALVDDIGCTGGKCLKGTCNPPPQCFMTNSFCAGSDDTRCCSGVCHQSELQGLGVCHNYVQTGDPCHVNADCLSGSCVGYRCQSACSHSDGSPCEDSTCRECQNGTCVNLADDTSCIPPGFGAGKCLNGTCNPDPQCLSTNSSCRGSDTPCCAGSCDPEVRMCLTQGERRDPCHVNADCLSGNCVGYRCE